MLQLTKIVDERNQG